jgi:hypothetical protein
VRLVQVLKSVQQYEFEDPYEQVREVTVPAAGEAIVDFELELRPEVRATN